MGMSLGTIDGTGLTGTARKCGMKSPQRLESGAAERRRGIRLFGAGLMARRGSPDRWKSRQIAVVVSRTGEKSLMRSAIFARD
jgi:hypothetical protein